MRKIYLDLDGPILDVAQRHYFVYKKVIEELSGVPLSQNIYWQKKRAKESLGEILDQSQLGDQLKDSFLKRFIPEMEKRENLLKYDRFSVPGMRKILKDLAAKSELVLVTLRKSKSNLFYQLKTLAIKDLFSEILVGYSQGELVQWEAKVAMLEKTKPSKGDIIVGDTEVDILAAKKLDLVSVAVTCGIRNEKILKTFKPDYLRRDIRSLPKIVEGS